MYIYSGWQASFEIFNFATKLWRAGGGLMKTTRYIPAVYIFENKLTVIGGQGNCITLRYFPYFFLQGQNLTRKAVVF